MRRLTAQQVKDIRDIINASSGRMERELTRAKEPGERDFYQRLLARNESLLEALPSRGGAEVEDISDEQRAEE